MPFLQPGASVGAFYRLVAKIGTGATGEVWEARNLTTNAVVAAKILKTEHAGEPHLVERFVRERSVLIGLDHQHIVRVQDLVIEGPILAILMDYLPGGSLREVLNPHRRLTPGDALTLTSEVMKGLAHAHAKNITHRDIKPDNVLLKRAWHPGESGIVCVSDFGIAAVVSEETRVHSGLVGTPRYMAPEYVRDANVSPAIDVYSTATLLYEMLVGRTPFGGSGSDFTIAYKQVTGRVARLDVPDPLWDYMERM